MPPLADHEPTVADLVANLRARCAAATTPGRLVTDVVVLPVDLVLAIADGIEASARTSEVDSYDVSVIAAQAAKDIVKLFVGKLFAPAGEEAARALDACETLGLTDAEVKTAIGLGLPSWASLAIGGSVMALMPLLWGLLRKGKAPK